jgi:hypothetical protein
MPGSRESNPKAGKSFRLRTGCICLVRYHPGAVAVEKDPKDNRNARGVELLDAILADEAAGYDPAGYP